MRRVIAPLIALVACRGEYHVPADALVSFEGAPPRNVLILSIDTLRRDRVGLVDGSDRTPTIDGLLRDGVWLSDHRSSSSWTYASVLCALAGADQEELGFAPMRGQDDARVPDALTFLAETLDDHASALVSANPLLGEGTGTAAGYDGTCGECEFTTTADELVDRGVERLDALLGTGEPWLLHLHFMDPHLPYDAPPAYLTALDDLPPIDVDLTDGDGLQQVKDSWDALTTAERSLILDHAEVLYNAEVAFLDDELARFLDAARARDALSDTLVVLWADHGEQFFEHGGIKHGSSLYAEENRVIAGFWAERLDPVVWEAPTTHADLAPTVLAALQREPPSAWTGLPVGTAPVGRPRYAAVLSAEAGATRQSVELEGQRLIYSWDGQLERYDLRADPAEHADLYQPGDATTQALWALLQPRIGLLGANEGAPDAVIPTP
jgi:arylsulfatase A-like enzyme